MRPSSSRGKPVGFAIVLAFFSVACALVRQPTPIVLPAPSATPEATAESQDPATATPMPAAPATNTPAPPTATATAAAVAPPTATLAPATATLAPATATPQPPPAWERVLFDAGATDALIPGQLDAATTRTYALGVAAGQLIDISAATQQDLTMAIHGVDGTELKPQGQPFFRGVVPSTQDYLVTLSAGNAAAAYTLNVIIPVRITFDPGAITVQLETAIPANRTSHFVIRALGGQTMTVATSVTQGQIVTIVYGADGAVLQSDHAGAPDFTGTLPSTQDYVINLRAVGGVPASVTIDVTIPPPE